MCTSLCDGKVSLLHGALCPDVCGHLAFAILWISVIRRTQCCACLCLLKEFIAASFLSKQYSLRHIRASMYLCILQWKTYFSLLTDDSTRNALLFATHQDGRTCLHFAVGQGNFQTAKILFLYGGEKLLRAKVCLRYENVCLGNMCV